MERRELELYRETMRHHREGARFAQSVGGEIGSRTRARDALRFAKWAARLEREWDAAERAGLVSFDVEPDDFGWSEGDLFGDCFDPKHASDIPGGMRTLEAQRRRALETVERDGVWNYVGKYRTHPDSRTWEVGGACGGIEGAEDVPEIRYDIYAETLGELRDSLLSRCPACGRPDPRNRKPRQ